MTLLSKIFLYRKWSFLLLHHSTFLRYLDRGVVSLSRMIIDRDLVVLFPIILTSLAVISRTSSFLKNEMARSSVEASSVSWCCSWDWCTAILPGGFRESGKSSEFGQWSACKQKQSIKIKTDFAFLRSHVVYFSPMTFGFVLVCLFVLVLLIVFCRLSSFFCVLNVTVHIVCWSCTTFFNLNTEKLQNHEYIWLTFN